VVYSRSGNGDSFGVIKSICRAYRPETSLIL